MKYVAIHDILESDFNAPLTETLIKENNIERLTKDKKQIVISKFEKEHQELYELKRSL